MSNISQEMDKTVPAFWLVHPWRRNQRRKTLETKYRRERQREWKVLGFPFMCVYNNVSVSVS
jgi:hypothetical protein